MIFATVGTQLPFPRLLGWLDRHAQATGDAVFAQSGDDPLAYTHIETRPFLDGAAFAERLARADLFVAHAGVGSLLAAMRAGKPTIIVPRSAALGEHRNDHQFATARQFAGTPGLHMAEDFERFSALLAAPGLEAPRPGARSPERDALVARLADVFAGWAR